ncbi:hypothetical protein, partial [Alicyclobacillus suci]|uniref:hypothetical protein n=1 Tax=Alicyclobacillus suci TaxID=2816080 RepID=UPI003F69B73E
MLNKWKIGLVTGAVAAMTASLAGCGNSTTASGNQASSPASSAGSGSTPAQGKPMTIVPAPYGSFQRNFNPFQYQTTANGGTFGFIY